MTRTAPILLLAATLAACSSATTGKGEGQERPEPAPPPATTTMLPRDTEMRVQLNDSLSTEHSRIGDRFSVTVLDPILTAEGRTVVPAGATVTGLVTGVDDSDHVGDEAYLRLNFIRLTIEKLNEPFAAEIVSSSLQVSNPTNSTSTAIGAAAGVVGAILSGDLKKAAEAGQLGAGAGSVISLGSSGREGILPKGTEFHIRTTANISLEK